MRDIRFRAWLKYEKFMEESLIIINDFAYWLDGQNDGRFILMQFTGLHDKNGKEIYEGDIGEYMDGEKIIRVRWSDIQARFVMDKWHEGKWIDCFYNFNEEVALDLNVIGNIYENGDLLKREG